MTTKDRELPLIGSALNESEKWGENLRAFVIAKSTAHEATKPLTPSNPQGERLLVCCGFLAN
jgi:hypothetical protein